MAIVLEAHYSKKLGLPGYSSHQYGVTIRAELSDINLVPQESERIYRLLQNSVDAEIQQPGWLPVSSDSPPPLNPDSTRTNGAEPWSCSLKQRELILTLVEDHQLDKQAIDALARERFGKGVRQLNRLEASGLIDELLERHGGSSAGRTHRGAFRRSPVRNGGAR
jgi:hypothetical protein